MSFIVTEGIKYMGLQITAFAMTLTGIPLIPYLANISSPDGAIERLGTGTAQLILAAIAVVELIIILKGIWTYRKDIKDLNEKITSYMEQEAKVLTKLVAENSVALTRHADATDNSNETYGRVATTISDLATEIKVMQSQRTKTGDAPSGG